MTVVIVVPGVTIVAVMVVDLMMVAAVIIAVPPAPRLGLVRDEYAPQQKCYERSDDDFHGVITSISDVAERRLRRAIHPEHVHVLEETPLIADAYDIDNSSPAIGSETTYTQQ